MSDLLKAAEDVKVLIRAFDGLRLLVPVLDRVGSLEQAAGETEVAQKKVADTLVKMKSTIATLDGEIAQKSKTSETLVKNAQEIADDIVQKANEECAEKLKSTSEACEKNISDTTYLVENMLKEMEIASKQHAKKLSDINKEIEDKEQTLVNVRSAIARLTEK